MLVSKWGNSLAVRLPKKLAEEMGLRDGDEIEIVKASKEKLEIAKLTDEERRRRFLKAMEQFHWPAPADYKFNRDEANER